MLNPGGLTDVWHLWSTKFNQKAHNCRSISSSARVRYARQDSKTHWYLLITAVPAAFFWELFYRATRLIQVCLGLGLRSPRLTHLHLPDLLSLHLSLDRLLLLLCNFVYVFLDCSWGHCDWTLLHSPRIELHWWRVFTTFQWFVFGKAYMECSATAHASIWICTLNVVLCTQLRQICTHFSGSGL